MLLAGLPKIPPITPALSSSAFFVDQIDSLASHYSPQTEIHFIVGFDTFERILDPEGKYVALYHRRFGDRREALRRLLSRSRLIVAGRSDNGLMEVRALAEREAGDLSDRILYSDLAPEIKSRSASEVRARIAAGLPVTGLVPEAVERYIDEHGLYRPRQED